MGALKEAVNEQQMQPVQKPQRTIKDVLLSQWDKVEKVMPKHMNSERLFQLAVSTVNHDPKLAQCDIKTLLSCVLKCSALGLEPSSVDGLGRAYILPFWNKKIQGYEATFILGYKGMIDLARRSGEIKDISARAVFEGDEFEYEFGLNEKLVHRPRDVQQTPDKLTHVYMVCHFKDGGHYMDVMTKAEIEGVRKTSKAKDTGPWKTDYVPMAKKSVIRRAFPFLPVSVEAQTAATSDETDGGYVKSMLTTEEVIPAEIVNASEAAGDGPGELMEAEPEQEGVQGAADASDETRERRAVCKSCGNIIEGIAPDADAADISFGCCETPDYVIEEA